MFRPLLSLRGLGLIASSVLAFLSAFLSLSPARAELTIEISGAGANRIPITIADFGGDFGSARAVTSVVRGDLERSGVFRLIDAAGLPLTETASPRFEAWKNLGADALAVGSVRPGGGRLEARFQLYDIARQTPLGGEALTTSSNMLRAAGHRIADFIYEKLTGEPGVFATRIAYVVKSGAARYELHIADADGQNAQAALISREPIISPTWSPDGSRLAYVSFENKKPIIYVHSLVNGRRVVIANFKGSNSAPAWSPDGRKLAVTLSKDGGSQIYLINADGSGVQRLSTGSSINTEACFAPDGQTLYFTSDRGGSPQIYSTSLGSGEVRRITFEGSYNVSPRISPDGRTMAFVTRNESTFRLAVMDLASHQVQVLTDSGKDESPSFAPNNRMILIATEIGGRGVLSAVSVDGRFKQRLSIPAGDVREPAWGPYRR
ncbi:MAG: Tol-Pal system beta propeller repeat protein TolB [Candidatus Accumulibacter sp.]|jgi:TolB protein|nr:Tol-Pal system beta propeller repeat protein TolB [Accumulibacter sp.]